jgi:hypothetical protein
MVSATHATVNKRLLDFMIIGAQKSGTTSLFKYMLSHPQLYMPPEKESPYFDDDEKVARGWDWYIGEYFGDAPADRLWGTVTPNYMIDPRVPERIREALPGVKLIAVLRDPVERAYSDYRMNVRRGFEARSFADAVAECLQPEVLERARQRPNRTNSYVTSGEYGRILSAYYRLFPSDQLLVFFTEELKHQPETVLQSVFQFLGVDTDFEPSNLGKVYHKGGSKRLIPGLEYRHLKRVRLLYPFRPIWRALLPQKARRRFWYWLEQRNVIPQQDREQASAAVRKCLMDHYAPDFERLSELIGREPPWSAPS